MDQPLLAFLHLAQFDHDTVFRGGCLVTDAATMPLEFRCTSGIQPTPLQRTLYGRKLTEYIARDLVSIPLARSLQARPDVIFVCMPEFLLARPELGIPTLLIQTSGDGKASLSAYPGREAEVESGRGLIGARRLKMEDVLEPFTRIQRALEEAHAAKVADKPAEKAKK